MTGQLHIGTCSWKYPSWQGLVYREPEKTNYLFEYSRKYKTVEIDQWFYALPDPGLVSHYATSVPVDFHFSIKVPRMITLTHERNSRSKGPLKANPTYLSLDLFHEFLERLAPLGNRFSLVFQFEYLNRQKMESAQQFIDQLGSFFEGVGPDLSGALEIRNKNFLTTGYFQFLRQFSLSHVFNAHAYMPPIHEVWNRFGPQISGPAVFRLLGGDRKKIEKITGNSWKEIVIPREEELNRIARVIREIVGKGQDAWVYVNNHFEGCAPLTIGKLLDKI